MSLVEDGILELSTTARSALGRDLPLIGDDVTVEHLLSRGSGIGDSLDEEVELDVDEYHNEHDRRSWPVTRFPAERLGT